MLHLVYGTNSPLIFASLVRHITVSFTFTYHTWQFIIFTILTTTITACNFSYSFSLLFGTHFKSMLA